MTDLAFDPKGVDATHEGVEFRMPRDLLEEAVGKPYEEMTDHDVLRLVVEDERLAEWGEPRRVRDILG